MTDAATMQRPATGRDDAFELIVREWLPMVYAAARRQVRDADLAEDVTQAAFLVLARRRAQLASHPNLGGFLIQTTRYCAAAALKRRRRQRHHEAKTATMRNTEPAAVRPDDLGPVLDAALARLNAGEREVLVLRYLRGLTLDEVSSRLGLSRPAAEKRQTRGLAHLRHLLGERYELLVPSAALPGLLLKLTITDVPAPLLSSTLRAVAAPSAAGSVAVIAQGASMMLALIQAKTIMTIVVSVALTLLAVGSAVHFAHAAGPHSTPSPNAAAQDAAVDVGPGARFVLHDGSWFELLAIATARGNAPPAVSWDPTGAPAGAPEWMVPQPDAGAQSLTVQLHVRYHHAPQSRVSVVTDPSWGWASNGENCTLMTQVPLPQAQQTITLRCRWSDQPWTVALQSDGKQSSSTQGRPDWPFGEMTLEPVSVGSAGLEVRVRGPLPHLPHDQRFVVIRDDARSITRPMGGWGSNARRWIELGFFPVDQVSPKNLKAIRYDVRPYSGWIEFRGIPLQPGAGAKVDVVTGKGEPTTAPARP